MRSLLEEQRSKRKEKKHCADAPCILLPCAPALCRNEWAPLSLPRCSCLQQQPLRKNLSSSSKQKKIRIGAKAIQKLRLKDLVGVKLSLCNLGYPGCEKSVLWIFEDHMNHSDTGIYIQIGFYRILLYMHFCLHGLSPVLDRLQSIGQNSVQPQPKPSRT